MKSTEKKKLKHCDCGSTEFITDLNSYDIYEIIDGELTFMHTEFIDNEEKYYCRKCGEELKT